MLETRRVAAAVLILLPVGLVGYLSFNSGGFYPGPPAYVALILCVALLLRVALAADPFEGLSWTLALPAAALAIFTVLTLASQAWSHAPGVALIEFDLPLIYLLALVLFGSVARTRERVGWTARALAAAIVVICACGLITRVLPHLWPTTPGLVEARLAFPLTYWNALGLMAALGIVLCTHLTSDLGERASVRGLAAAAMPILLVTLYFTFSRGGVLIAVVSLVVYIVLGRPRGVVGGLLAVVPTSAIALVVAYDANLLATNNPTAPGAVSQGHTVALVVLVCVVGAGLVRALLLRVDRRLVISRPASRPFPQAAWGVVALIALIVVIALSGTISHEYHRFVSSSPVSSKVNLRSRLTNPGNNGRLDMWRVALHGFESAPLVGNGAGTFATLWTQHRATGDIVVDAHSLYVEVLDELGLVGLILLVVVIVSVLGRAARLIRGPDRALYAAIFAVLLAWALHAGVDWDWEMPATTIIFFILGGSVLARARSDAPSLVETARSFFPERIVSPQRRVLLGLGCVLLGVAPMYVWLSQRKLDQALAAYSAGNCQAASSAALSSISILGTRADPYEILGYCDAKRNMPRLAIAAIDKAISLDPNNSDYVLDLALVRAAAGQSPLAAARRALALNPLDPDVKHVWRIFSADTASQWPSDGLSFLQQFNPQ